MHIISSYEMKGKEINLPDTKNVIMKPLITKNEGAPTFALRQFELAMDGHTPYHRHPWEHEVYVPPGELHQFKNRGEGMLKFLCIVPNEGHI